MPEKSLLDSLYIAAPCNVKWKDMTGDERERMCALCTKKVYNISDMTKPEAETFLRRKGDSVCMRFYRRSDGTILTDDCPVGLRKIRNAFRALRQTAAAICGLIIAVPMAVAKPVAHTIAVKTKWIPTAADADHGAAYAARANYFMRFPVAGMPAFVDPAAFGLPPFAELTSGRYHLTGDEICELKDDIYLRITGDAEPDRNGTYHGHVAVERLNKEMTAIACFKKAQVYENGKEFKIAELYYKLTFRYLNYYKALDQDLRVQWTTKYGDFLLRRGRVEEAMALISNPSSE